MRAIDWKAVMGLLMVTPKTLLYRQEGLRSDIISRMTLSGTDTNFWYQEASLSLTARAVRRASKVEPGLGVGVKSQPTTFQVSTYVAVS